MSDYSDFPAMRELRDSLEQAAVQQAAERAPARPRRRRLAVLLVPAAVVAAVAGAGAANLLATGEPVPDPPGKSPRYRADANGKTIALTARDPQGEGAFAVETYTSSPGQSCVLGGQLRGQTVGKVEGGVFRPYAASLSGPCMDPAKDDTINDLLYFREANRSMLYGIAADRFSRVVLTIDGERHETAVGHNGAYLFLFEGNVSSSRITLTVR